MSGEEENDVRELVVPAPVARATRSALLVATAAVVSIGATFATPAFALGAVLPWCAALAWIPLLQWTQARGDGATVRVRADGLRHESAHVSSFVPWSGVARLVDAGSVITAELANGTVLQMTERDGTDLRAILEIAPKDTVYVRVQADPTAPRKQARKTVLLWILLVVMMIAIWRLTNP